MKLIICTLLFAFHFGPSPEYTYVGSTPAHDEVRAFLGISMTDSIDFIRWKLDVGANKFKLQCRYGISQPSTLGFRNEKTVSFDGSLDKTGNNYYLQHDQKKLSLLHLNTYIIHLLDHNGHMLVGNGGYSFALNSSTPVKTTQFNISSVPVALKYPLVYEGRTP